MFLLFKLAYQNLDYDLVIMLQVLAACSCLIWIRTFCLMPYYRSDPTKTVFQQSFIGRCFNKETEIEAREPDESNVTLKTIIPVFKSVNTWQYAALYTILCCRIKSIQGWIFPWLDWTYSNIDDDQAKTIISDQLDFYGYTYFVSPIVALFPGLLSQLIKFITKNDSIANLFTLVMLMTISEGFIFDYEKT